MTELGRELRLDETIAIERRGEAAQTAEERAQRLELAAAAVKVLVNLDDPNIFGKVGDFTGVAVTRDDLVEASVAVTAKAEQERAIGISLEQGAQLIQENGLPR